MRSWRHWAATLATLAFTAAPGSAYYYYVHYNGRTAPFTPIVEKFDLTALTNKTVPFFISDQGPSAMAPGDSFQAVVSEIRSAAKVWNDVATSDLRLAYAGLFTSGTQQNAQAITVEFSDDIPPGLLALSGPEVRSASNGQFIPVQRSRMLLRRDLSQSPALPSYSELFYTTLVHEFGHTLGLQHTFTSSVMSTATTSASTRAQPLAPDDIAGISLLYPAAGYLPAVGSISGRVTLSNGSGVNLASVVAISSSNAAISTLTNPDGTFQIDGLQPMQYYLYVHPLPGPLQGESYPANITPPIDSKGVAFPATTNFTTVFYPGTRDFNQAQWVFVYGGSVTGGVNFTVNSRTGSSISSVRVYGYTSTNVPVTAPQLFIGVPATLVASAPSGLLQNGNLTPGLKLGMVGTPATLYDVRPYYQQFVAFDLMVGNTAGPGPKHLIFSSPTDLYVLPSGFTVVQEPPPAITSVQPAQDANGGKLVAISGTNIQSDTRIYFDGLPGTIQGTSADGKLLVTPPPAAGGYTATVVALNSSDAQSSLFLQAANPPTYTYDSSAPAVITASPQFLAPSVDTVVDINTQNTNFVDGQVTVGFGLSDVQVKRVQVLSPTHLSVTAAAPAGVYVPTSSMNITNGLRVISQSLGYSITQPAN